MNKTSIEWTDYSWNPIFGCDHGCFYCYARKISQRFPKNFPNGFKPTFHPERLVEIHLLKKPAKIFVCSCADLFASWTPVRWRDAVLDEIFGCEVKHTFQLLTKNPERIPPIEFPENVWVGATVTGTGDIDNIEALRKVKANRFVSFEPLLRYLEPDLWGIDWVIIGKLTGAKQVKMDWSWVGTILAEGKRNEIPVFMKNNLLKEFPKIQLRQEFPKGMA